MSGHVCSLPPTEGREAWTCPVPTCRWTWHVNPIVRLWFRTVTE